MELPGRHGRGYPSFSLPRGPCVVPQYRRNRSGPETHAGKSQFCEEAPTLKQIGVESFSDSPRSALRMIPNRPVGPFRGTKDQVRPREGSRRFFAALAWPANPRTVQLLFVLPHGCTLLEKGVQSFSGVFGLPCLNPQVDRSLQRFGPIGRVCRLE